MRQRLETAGRRLESLAARLESLSPLKVLSRGYSLTLKEADHAVVRSDGSGPSRRPADHVGRRRPHRQPRGRNVRKRPNRNPFGSDAMTESFRDLRSRKRLSSWSAPCAIWRTAGSAWTTP